MKKLFLLTFFLLSTIILFSQDALFGRAYLFYTGVSDGTDIVWNEYPTKCDILVQIEDQKLTIYSETLQTYRIINLKENGERIAKYLAVNSDGIKCYLYVGQYGESDDIGVTIEFSDLAWTYVVSEDD
jgi:hypothetical protein